MNKKVVLGIASVLLLGGGVYLWTSIAKKKKQQREAETKAKIAEAVKNVSSKSEKQAIAAQILAEEKQKEAVDKVLEEVGDVKVGKYAYPKGADVNVRTSAKVDNGGLDFRTNFIYKNYTKRVGLITAVVDSEEYGDKNKWYKVKLDEPKEGWMFDDDYGYVRADKITVKNL